MIASSSNNFSKFQPSRSSSAFATRPPTQSANTFSSAPVTASSNLFSAKTLATYTSTFGNAPMTRNLDVFSGDNTASSPYGGDYSTFGAIYGEENYGGISHFKNRTRPPGIAH